MSIGILAGVLARDIPHAETALVTIYLTMNSLCNVHVFWHDRYTFPVDGFQNTVLNQSD